MRHRALSEKNKYYIPREDYLTAIHYSLRYPLWIEELNSCADTAQAIRYDKDKVQTSGDYDPTSDTAIKLLNISDRVNMVDNIIAMVSKGMDRWLRLGVCYGLTFDQLKAKGLPCERDMYYEVRRHYYFELSKQI